MPLKEPGRVREYAIMTRISTKSVGMATLENFSIPCFTPPSTMAVTMAIKAVWARMGCQGEVMKREKREGITSAGISVKLKERDLKRYCTLQPPTTE